MTQRLIHDNCGYMLESPLNLLYFGCILTDFDIQIKNFFHEVVCPWLQKNNLQAFSFTKMHTFHISFR